MPTEFRPAGGRPRVVVASEGTLLLDQNRPVAPRSGAADRGPHKDLVTLNNFELIARSWYRRRIFQMSALSTVDGRFHAYRGGNG
jgi:hypothetical protein